METEYYQCTVHTGLSNSISDSDTKKWFLSDSCALLEKTLEKDRFLLRNGIPTHSLASTAIAKEPLFGIANVNAIAKVVWTEP